ncbi:hypothetical protein BGZ83_002546 [Gryganskiella cystojenkinii]|nr:hypothetical protein BGZ83_002546 [Gryganskiella cystojenkinii]
MAHLTPAYILAAMDSNCTPSDMLAYNGHHLHQHDGHNNAFYEDSDSDSSSYSGSSSSSFSTHSMHIQDSGAINHLAHHHAHAHHQQQQQHHHHQQQQQQHHHHQQQQQQQQQQQHHVHPQSMTPPPAGPSNGNGNGATNTTTLVHQQIIPGQAITYHYFCNFPTCDYHSARSDPVKRHRDTHYPDYKPYTCNYCQSSSARRDSTREHCLKQHKDDSENAFRYDGSIPKPEGWIAYEPKRSPWPPLMG